MFQAPHQELCRQFSVPRGLTKDKNEQNKRSPSSQVFEHTDLESMSNGGLMVGIGKQWILCGRLHVGPVCPPPPSLSAKHTRFFKKKKTLSDAFKMISSFRISHSWFFLYPVKDCVNFRKTQESFSITCPPF